MKKKKAIILDIIFIIFPVYYEVYIGYFDNISVRSE